jgi:DNA-binding LacI/PurR family transcriptional regulator
MARLKDVAAIAQVSPATVSFILRGERLDRYPQTTKDRVLAAAEALAYRPNTQARAVRSGRRGAIGLVLSDEPMASFIAQNLLSGIQDVCVTDSLSLHIERVNLRDLDDDKDPPEMRRWSIDGALVDITFGPQDRLAEILARRGVPAVWLNTDRKHDAVRYDDRRACLDATARLIAAGHRRIAYVNVFFLPSQDFAGLHYSYRERWEGYLAAMAAAGLPPLAISSGPDRTAWGGQLLASLQGPDRPTAMLCYDNDSAITAVLAAARAGLQIPRDLSLVTNANYAPTLDGRIISCVILPEREMGMDATHRLIALLSGAKPQPSAALATGWHPGETLAPPPA